LGIWQDPHIRPGWAPIIYMGKMESIRIDKVNVLDRTFCVSYPLEDDHLLASVAKFGIVTPLGLLKKERAVIVTGHKRAEAARILGIEEIPYVFLDLDGKQALLTSINDNLARSLNTVEKAICIEKMRSLGFSAQDTYEVMAMLGLPARENAHATCIAAASAEEATKSFIVRHHLPITVVEQLFWFDPGEQRNIIAIAGPRRPTVSSLREALQLMMLLKVKRGAIDFTELALSGDMEALKGALKRQTHPLLSGLEEKLAGILAACALPPNIRVRVDKAFEKEAIDIEIRARNNEEVEGALARLDRLAGQGFFRSIFELTHGAADRF